MPFQSRNSTSWSLSIRWSPQLEFAFFGLTLLLTFLMSFNLLITHVAIVPLLLLYIIRTQAHCILSKSSWLNLLKKEQSSEIIWLLFFIAVASIQCTFGFSPARSFSKLSSLLITSSLIFISRDFSRAYNPSLLVQTLIAGQVITALYSCSTKALLGYSPEIFLGEVTHSGQLAIVIPLFLGYFGKDIIESNKSLLLAIISIGLLSFSCFLQLPLLFFFCLIGFCFYCTTRNTLNIALLATCLCTNLKRGPWLGVGCSILYFMFRWRPRLILPSLIIISAVAISIPQVRNRILEGQHDFNIAGGRKIMWQIGGELVQKYPMGIGFGNSRELRSFSYEIPPQHRHFHNNFLNIAVETGWLGILIFLTWLGMILRNVSTLQGFPIALLSNQIAGLVEYNFGDSEILMILFMCFGVYLASEEVKTINNSLN